MTSIILIFYCRQIEKKVFKNFAFLRYCIYKNPKQVLCQEYHRKSKLWKMKKYFIISEYSFQHFYNTFYHDFAYVQIAILFPINTHWSFWQAGWCQNCKFQDQLYVKNKENKVLEKWDYLYIYIFLSMLPAMVDLIIFGSNIHLFIYIGCSKYLIFSPSHGFDCSSWLHVLLLCLPAGLFAPPTFCFHRRTWLVTLPSSLRSSWCLFADELMQKKKRRPRFEPSTLGAASGDEDRYSTTPHGLIKLYIL